MATTQLSPSLKILADSFENNREAILNDYYTFLKFQSISSEPAYKKQILACAAWLQDYLKKMGFTLEQWETSGHPVLYAHNMNAGPDKPTLLIYNHYDVQPVDPLELWQSPPFEPTVRGGEVYARGAQDNKGQCFYVLQALKGLIKRDGKLPINIKLCIEGEEEVGSTGLSQILTQKAQELKADYLAIVDLGINTPTTPAISLGVRGIATLEVEIEDSNTDLHSGSHGGVVYNPIHALVELLAKVRDPATGKVLIPGFYDNVKGLSEKEKGQISLDFDHATYQKEFGTQALGGEKEFSPQERAWVRPTLEINGIAGGYAGQGFKTVIPSKASAKLSCRLVPDQDPHEIGNLVINFLEKNAPKGLKVRAKLLSGGGVAVRTSPSSKIVQAFSKAYSEVFQAPCEYIFSGGSIPVVAELAKASQAEVVLLGLGLPGDKIHAPNEHFGLDRIEKGYLIMCRALELLSEVK